MGNNTVDNYDLPRMVIPPLNRCCISIASGAVSCYLGELCGLSDCKVCNTSQEVQ